MNECDVWYELYIWDGWSTGWCFEADFDTREDAQTYADLKSYGLSEYRINKVRGVAE